MLSHVAPQTPQMICAEFKANARHKPLFDMLGSVMENLKTLEQAPHMSHAYSKMGTYFEVR